MRAAPLLLAPALLAAAQPLPSLKEVVERFDAAQARVRSFQAPFTLTLRRSLLKTPTVTKGTVYLQDSSFVHFSFAPPEDLVLHLTPKALLSYSPGAGEGEMLKIGLIRNTDRRFLGLGQRLSELSDYFKAGLADGRELPGCYRLDLAPRALSVRRRMQSLQIWVDRESYLPRQVLWIERGGDSWHLELGHPTLNQPLPASVTGFQIPKGVPLRSEFSFFATRRK